MEAEQSPHQPRYFIANFGEKDSSTNPVGGGCYPVPTKYNDTKIISKGDVILLCCWAGHKNLYKGDAWGLGKVTDKKERNGRYYIYYKWIQFTPAISNVTIYNCLKAEGKEGKFITGAAYEPNWLFNIIIQASKYVSLAFNAVSIPTVMHLI